MLGVGWLVIAGWMSILAGSGYLGGQQIAAVATLNNPDYVYARWQVTLIFWLMIAVAILINTVVASVLPKIESVVLIIHILGFFAVLIPIVYVGIAGTFPELLDTDALSAGSRESISPRCLHSVLQRG